MSGGLKGLAIAIGTGKNGNEQQDRFRDFLMGLTVQSRGVKFCAILSYILSILNKIWIVFFKSKYSNDFHQNFNFSEKILIFQG